jgi:hypothetical protein
MSLSDTEKSVLIISGATMHMLVHYSKAVEAMRTNKDKDKMDQLT